MFPITTLVQKGVTMIQLMSLKSVICSVILAKLSKSRFSVHCSWLTTITRIGKSSQWISMTRKPTNIMVIAVVCVCRKNAHWQGWYIDIGDVEDSMLTAIKHWYAVYKEPDGSPENNFGFEGRFMNKVRGTACIIYIQWLVLRHNDRPIRKRLCRKRMATGKSLWMEQHELMISPRMWYNYFKVSIWKLNVWCLGWIYLSMDQHIKLRAILQKWSRFPR